MFQNVLGPMIVDAFGRRLASVPGWRAKYSNRVKGGSYRWSKQKLYIMLCKYISIQKILSWFLVCSQQ